MLADVYATLRWLNSLPVSQIERGAANRLPDGTVAFHDLHFGSPSAGGGGGGGGGNGGEEEDVDDAPSLSYTLP